MAKKGKASGGRMPTPEQIMRRHDRKTGETSQALAGATVRTTFAVGGPLMDQVVVRQLGIGAERTIPIGRYNPGTQKWGFAPEYVDVQERGPLTRLVRREGVSQVSALNTLLVEAEMPVVDVYHPYTHKVRADIDRRLRELPLQRFLARPAVRAAMAKDGSNVVAADSYTQVYPVIGTLFRDVKLVEEVGIGDTITTPAVEIKVANKITLDVVDAIVSDPERPPGATYRDNRTMILATRSEDDSAVWLPNTDLVTPDDWPVFNGIITALEHAKAENPDFSLLHCAVSLGDEYAHAVVNYIDPT